MPDLVQSIHRIRTLLAALADQAAMLRWKNVTAPDATSGALEMRIRILEEWVDMLHSRLVHLERSWQLSPPGANGTSGGPASLGVTHDNRYAIHLYGFIQARYQVASGGAERTSSLFTLRRAFLGVSGHVGSERLKYKLLLYPIRSVSLLDSYIEYEFDRNVAIRVGQYKTQFTRHLITSSARLAFAERPQAIGELGFTYDIQLGIHGTAYGERLGYYAGLGNGTGIYRTESGVLARATLRIDTVVTGERFRYSFGDHEHTTIPTFVVGVGVVHDIDRYPEQDGRDTDAGEAVEREQVSSASIDVIFRHRGLEAVLEGIWRQEDRETLPDPQGGTEPPGWTRARHTYAGLVGHITYALPWNVLIGGRVGYSRLPLDHAGGASPASRMLELDGVVQLRLTDSQASRLAYTWHDHGGESMPASWSEHRLTLETQVSF